MAAVMMPRVTRPTGVVRSVALSRPRLSRRSFQSRFYFLGMRREAYGLVRGLRDRFIHRRYIHRGAGSMRRPRAVD